MLSLGKPQALQTSYASRVRHGRTALFVTTSAESGRGGHKRGSAAAAYADFDAFDEDDDEDDDPTFTQSPPAGSGVDSNSNLETKVALAQSTRHAVYTDAQLKLLADEDEVLIPVRLNLNVEGARVQDFLLWNVREPALTPEQFAIVTCNDLDLPVGYTSNIANAIKSAISDYGDIAEIKLPDDMSVRVIVQLSVNLGMELYEDRFEWDISDPGVTPHAFARQVAADLALDTEFVPAIAHSVTESLLRFKREVLAGHVPSLENAIAPGSLSRHESGSGARYDPDGLGDDWVPTTETLTQSEIERREMERERMIRRMKRESLRGGELELAMFGRKRRRRESPGPW